MTPSPNQVPPSVRAHKIHFYRQIAFTFIGAALVVLIGLIYFSLSQAVILITPKLESVKSEFYVLVKDSTAQTAEGIQAQLVFTTVDIEKKTASQLLQEGEAQPATGTVTMKNTSSQAQPLVATTRLLSDGNVLFRLKKAVTVPAKGEVQAEVYADQPGKQGEIAPSRFTVPGLNQARQQEVYAESKSAMTGGTKSIYRVTKEAIELAIKEANEQITSQAQTQLQTAGIDSATLLPNSNLVEVLSQEVTPKEGADVPDFTVKVKAQVVFVVAKKEDLLKLAKTQLQKTTSLGYELSSSDEGSLTYSLTNFDAANKTAQIKVLLDGKRRISTNNPDLDPSQFVGLKPATVKERLEGEEGIESVDIQLRPFWLRRIPRLVDHIYVQFGS